MIKVIYYKFRKEDFKMEGNKIYEQSRTELYSVLKQTSTDKIVIDLSKLDSFTKGQMIGAIRNVANQRVKDIDKVILGVQ